MRIEPNTTYFADSDATEFMALLETPDQYVDRLFNVRAMDLDGTGFGGWYICMLRKYEDRFVFVPLFNSGKDGFLYEFEVIESYMVTSFTMYEISVVGIDPDSDFFRAYNLPQDIVRSFYVRAKRKDGNLLIAVQYEGSPRELEFTHEQVVVLH